MIAPQRGLTCSSPASAEILGGLRRSPRGLRRSPATAPEAQRSLAPRFSVGNMGTNVVRSPVGTALEGGFSLELLGPVQCRLPELSRLPPRQSRAFSPTVNRTSAWVTMRQPRSRLLNLPARKLVVGGNRQYLREGRMRGFVSASPLGLTAALAKGAPVILAASVPGHVHS
jgi:hypothetical protein